MQDIQPSDFYALAQAPRHHKGPEPRRTLQNTENDPPGTPQDTEKDTHGALPGPALHDRPAILPHEFGTRPTLVWDTETAGLGAPGICQLSYILIEDGKLTEYDKILRLPMHVRMSSKATSIHRITAEASAAGAHAAPELLSFWEVAQRVMRSGGEVVGHNVAFDCRAFDFTCEKLGFTRELQHTHMIDTMVLSKPYTHLRNVRGHPKQYRLAELYERLFGAPPDWARLHDSLEDVRVTALCFREGRRIGWW